LRLLIESGVVEATQKNQYMSARIFMVSIISLGLGFVLGTLVAATFFLRPSKARSKVPSVKPVAQLDNEPAQLTRISAATAAILASSIASPEGRTEDMAENQWQSQLETVAEQQRSCSEDTSVSFEDARPPVLRFPVVSRPPSASTGFVSSLQTIFEADLDANPSNPLT